MKKIGIASDHAGYEMKEFLVGYLNAMGYEVLDFVSDAISVSQQRPARMP